MKYVLEVKKSFKFMGALVLEGETVKAGKQTFRSLYGHVDFYFVNLGLGREFLIRTDEIQWVPDCDKGERFEFVGAEF